MPEEDTSTRRRSSVTSQTNDETTANAQGQPQDEDGLLRGDEASSSDNNAIQPRQSPSPSPLPHNNHRPFPVRVFWFTIGIVSLGLGGVGIVLPGLPTTPFILLASFAFLRSSETFHNYLLQSKLFGPILTQWNEHRALPSKKVKIVAVSVTIVCFTASMVYFAAFMKVWWASLLLGMMCVGVCVFLIRLPVVPPS